VPELSIGQARRIALAAQGFSDPRPCGRIDVRHLRRVLRRVGLFQMDAVNVLVRAHYMPLFSRLGPYRRELLDEATHGRGELFETWAHERCLLPVERWPLIRRCLDENRSWGERFARDNMRYVDSLLEELEQRGPLAAGDFEHPGARRGRYWTSSEATNAMTWHFRKGHVGIAARPHFTRIYDLIERIVPSEIYAQARPTHDEALRKLLLLGAASHGVGTAKDLADYYRLPIVPSRRILAALADTGELEKVHIDGWEDATYRYPAAVLPRCVDARALLSPFDPLVWNRERSERLFGFHYRIEIYVPAPKRKYGYYVLPFLLGDRLAGRVDLKADRAASRLLVQAAYHEDGEDADEVAAALKEELVSMAGWLGLEEVQVKRRGNLAAALRLA
jgi:uncharacterized protein YcaQ